MTEVVHARPVFQFRPHLSPHARQIVWRSYSAGKFAFLTLQRTAISMRSHPSSVDPERTAYAGQLRSGLRQCDARCTQRGLVLRRAGGRSLAARSFIHGWLSGNVWYVRIAPGRTDTATRHPPHLRVPATMGGRSTACGRGHLSGAGRSSHSANRN